jgi:hypothetical protein
VVIVDFVECFVKEVRGRLGKGIFCCKCLVAEIAMAGYLYPNQIYSIISAHVTSRYVRDMVEVTLFIGSATLLYVLFSFFTFAIDDGCWEITRSIEADIAIRLSLIECTKFASVVFGDVFIAIELTNH